MTCLDAATGGALWTGNLDKGEVWLKLDSMQKTFLPVSPRRH